MRYHDTAGNSEIEVMRASIFVMMSTVWLDRSRRRKQFIRERPLNGNQLSSVTDRIWAECRPMRSTTGIDPKLTAVTVRFPASVTSARMLRGDAE
jgi:hypothetical protein